MEQATQPQESQNDKLGVKVRRNHGHPPPEADTGALYLIFEPTELSAAERDTTRQGWLRLLGALLRQEPLPEGHVGPDPWPAVPPLAGDPYTSAGPSWAMVRTLTLRFLELFQDVADHQQALLRLLPPGVFFL